MLAIPAALLWLGTGIVLVLAEVMSGSMVLLALGLAAISVSMLAILGVGLATQLVLFCLLTGLFLPLAIKVIQPLMFSRRHGSARSNASAHTIRLEPGAVVSVVEAETGLGVPHGGDVFRVALARRPSGDVIRAGDTVRILYMEGTNAFVELPSCHSR